MNRYSKVILTPSNEENERIEFRIPNDAYDFDSEMQIFSVTERFGDRELRTIYPLANLLSIEIVEV